MGPIHKGVIIGRRVADLERLAKKVKKKLIAQNICSFNVIDTLLTRLETYGDNLEHPKDLAAENGDADEFIFKSQLILIEQLLRNPV